MLRSPWLYSVVALLGLVVLALGQSQPLPGTLPLGGEEDLSERMMDGAHRFVERQIEESVQKRRQYWRRDFSSAQAYYASVTPNRNRLLQIIGAVDPRLPVRMERCDDDGNPALVAETAGYRTYQVRWAVLEGVTGEGLLLEPKAGRLASAVALPNAGQTPEQLAGLAPGLPPDAQFARRLAENGFEVLVPVLIDRGCAWSGHPNLGHTDQTHREWVYRQAFHMGRHPKPRLTPVPAERTPRCFDHRQHPRVRPLNIAMAVKPPRHSLH
jgi:hypothetical protein